MKTGFSLDLEERLLNRRSLLTRLASGVFLARGSGAFAEALTQTPMVEEGPFYPNPLPLDTDNDLLIVNDAITPAVGEITHLGGRLLDSKGQPIRNATVEIWCVDHMGVYYRDRPNQSAFDTHFQGFGRFLTGSTGEYYFRTIKPVRYPGRFAPHIHFKIKRKGHQPWTTQMFIKGYPGNDQDGVYRGIGDAKRRASVTVDFAPMRNSKIGELSAKFNIVMGYTPGDNAG
jgi:protocatechuate 3,4-dioxygenase beta subunit